MENRKLPVIPGAGITSCGLIKRGPGRCLISKMMTNSLDRMTLACFVEITKCENCSIKKCENGSNISLSFSNLKRISAIA